MDEKEINVEILNADTINVKHLNVETHDVKEEDITKAKKKGSFFGDPILVIE